MDWLITRHRCCRWVYSWTVDVACCGQYTGGRLLLHVTDGRNGTENCLCSSVYEEIVYIFLFCKVSTSSSQSCAFPLVQQGICCGSRTSTNRSYFVSSSTQHHITSHTDMHIYIYMYKTCSVHLTLCSLPLFITLVIEMSDISTFYTRLQIHDKT